jgi:hypothetical protein
MRGVAAMRAAILQAPRLGRHQRALRIQAGTAGDDGLSLVDAHLATFRGQQFPRAVLRSAERPPRGSSDPAPPLAPFDDEESRRGRGVPSPHYATNYRQCPQEQAFAALASLPWCEQVHAGLPHGVSFARVRKFLRARRRRPRPFRQQPIQMLVPPVLASTHRLGEMVAEKFDMRRR